MSLLNFHFGNPLRSKGGGNIPPKLLELLKKFDETLTKRIRELIPKDTQVASFEWMISAMESICATHEDVKQFITDLELPVSAWDEKWIEVYMDISLTLLDLCIAFSSDISRMNQGNILLHCTVYNLTHDFHKHSKRARSSFETWRESISEKNQKKEKYSDLLNTLKESLDLPKVKNSPKGKLLMSAMYGMKVQTFLVCSVFSSIFSSTDIMNLDVLESSPWVNAFHELQTSVNKNLEEVFSTRKITLEEMNSVDCAVEKLYPFIEEEIDPKVGLSELKSKVDRFSHVLGVLGKDVDGFFKVIMSSRDALISGLRGHSYNMMNKSCSSNRKQLTVK